MKASFTHRARHAKRIIFKPDGCTGIPDGEYRKCCNEHDWHYNYRGRYDYDYYKRTGGLKEARINRREADRRLWQCMRRYEDPVFSKLVYRAVRLLGWYWWYDVGEKMWWIVGLFVALLTALLLLRCSLF